MCYAYLMGKLAKTTLLAFRLSPTERQDANFTYIKMNLYKCVFFMA